MKLYLASFNRASDGAIESLKRRLIEKKMYTDNASEATHILAVGDRSETFDFVLSWYRKNKPIIHLWAGEVASWSTHDDVYRHAMTLMSEIQFCTNKEAMNVVTDLCWNVSKEPNAHVIGNLMLDDLEIDKEFKLPETEYNLVLYNPPSRMSDAEINEEIESIHKIVDGTEYIWIEPNGDKGSELLQGHFTHSNFQRGEFLALLKNCRRFITNSSCQYYEAPFLINKSQIVSIGKRNSDRNSKDSEMGEKGAVNKIIDILEKRYGQL